MRQKRSKKFSRLGMFLIISLSILVVHKLAPAVFETQTARDEERAADYRIYVELKKELRVKEEERAALVEKVQTEINHASQESFDYVNEKGQFAVDLLAANLLEATGQSINYLYAVTKNSHPLSLMMHVVGMNYYIRRYEREGLNTKDAEKMLKSYGDLLRLHYSYFEPRIYSTIFNDNIVAKINSVD